MNPNEYNLELLARLRASVQDFMDGGLGLDEVQGALQSTLDLLENDGSGAAEALRLAEADLEEIRFTRLFDEQHLAVVSRLGELVSTLPGDGG
ncbi:MAG: hypothetical protein KJ792_09810 [Actinobacteria bacterium]|nr:hypothetical protein [Actinomycetota bacterium]